MITLEKKTHEKLRFFSKCGYTPSAAQMEFHLSEARFRTLCAGARFGKSMACGAECAYALVAKPDCRIWIVANIYELAEREFLHTVNFLSACKIKDGRSLMDVGKLSYAVRGSRSIRFPWGSFCQTKTADKPQALLGEELDLLVIGEASQMPREPWNRMLRPRLGPRSGKMIAASTPNSDSGLFMDFFNKGNDESEEDWASWQFSTLDNPTFSRDEWEIAKKELDEKIFQEQYEGKFVSRRGVVFNFEDEIHVFSHKTEEMENWPHILGWQAGYNNPFAVVIIAISPIDGSYWVVDEIHQEKALTPDIVVQIPEKTKGKRILTSVTDYYAYQLQDELKREGIETTYNDEKKFPKKFAQIKRIQCIQNIMKQGKLHFLNGLKTLKEMRAVKWQDEQKEEKERAESELPLTKYLQGTLAISYVLAFCEAAKGKNIYEYY